MENISIKKRLLLFDKLVYILLKVWDAAYHISCFLTGYDLTATMRDVNKKFSVRYFLNLVLVDEEDRRYFKQQVTNTMTNNSIRC